MFRSLKEQFPGRSLPVGASNFKELSGFSWDWIESYLKDRESWSRKRLEVEYQCTYLNRKTLHSVNLILDVGCGGGFLARYLERAGRHVTYVGLDRSWPALTAARERFPHRPLVLSDIIPLPFTTNVFDLAYARDVIIHSRAPYEAIQELYRVSRNLLLRIRTAEIIDLFTTPYRDSEAVHHFFPLAQMLNVLKALSPSPQWIRYRIHTRYPRMFEARLYRQHGGFSSYFVTDLFVAKGPSWSSSIPVFNDTSSSVAAVMLRKFLRWDQRAYIRSEPLKAC